MELTTIQEIIERSLFEKIRLELVSKGYLPDITDFESTQAGYNSYNSAISDIVTSKGFCIELFNQSPNTEKGIKKVPRIVVRTVSCLPGDLGGVPGKYFKETSDGKNYEAFATPPQRVSFFINFHLVTNTVEQYRILNAIMALAVPRRGYINWYTNEETGLNKTFFCRYLNYWDNDNLSQGLIEKVYAYEIPDVYDTTTEKLSEALIAKISEITLHPNISSYMGGSWGEPTIIMVGN